MDQLGVNNKLFEGEAGLKAGLSWRLFVFFIATFSIITLSYVGLDFGYKSFLMGSIDSITKEVEDSAARVGLREQEHLIGFYSQIVNLNSRIREHPFPSFVFPFLEKSIHEKIAYSSVSVDVPGRALTIDGVADSYETLSAELAFLEESDDVVSVALGQNSLDKNQIRFNIKVVLRPDFFKLPASEERL